MKNTHKVTIGSTEYTFLRLGAREGMALRSKLVKVVAPVMLALAGAKAGSSLADLEVSPSMLSNVGQALANGLDSAEVVAVVEGLMHSVLIGGNPGETTWDTHFAGNYTDLDKVLLEAVKHNGFFGELAKVASLSP